MQILVMAGMIVCNLCNLMLSNKMHEMQLDRVVDEKLDEKLSKLNSEDEDEDN